MKNLLLLTLSLLFSLQSFTQTDFVKQDQLLLDAYRSKENKQYKKALNLYEQAFEIGEVSIIGKYLNAAICAAEINNIISCEKWMKAAVVNQKALLKSIQNFSKNETYQLCFEKIKSQHDSLLDKYYNSIENHKVQCQLQELINLDQFSRKLGQYHLGISEEEQAVAFEAFLEAQKNKDSIAMKLNKAILWPKVSEEHKAYERRVSHYTDSLNVRALMEITKQYGWQEEGYLLLWHQRGTYGEENWIWNYFIPLINAEIEKGKLSPSYWAALEDISSIIKTGKSIYGYHPGKVDPEKVNVKRKEIGLPELTKEEIEDRNKNPYGGRMF